ncbi:GatB/YqeY domain-containing protein [Candidatus Parcubacteria bacterium]|jgi:hypothetical protein|nr:GatB/YqeY domain-containing protein [Candidatus Parcubacteria bacterium]
MSVVNTIEKNLKEALRSKDEIKLTTLRMLKSAFKNKSIELKVDELDDKEAGIIVKKEVKKRQDSIKAYKEGNREDLAQREEAEMNVLDAYLPEMMSEEDLAQIVAEAIEENENNFGLIMKAVMSKTDGQADGQTVQRLVKEKLGS